VTIERPVADWIRIPVTPIVSADEWDEVQVKIASGRSNNLHYLTRTREPERDPICCGVSHIVSVRQQAPGALWLCARFALLFCYWSRLMPSGEQAGRRMFASLDSGRLCRGTSLGILYLALLSPHHIVQKFASFASEPARLSALKVRHHEATNELRRANNQERVLLERALNVGFSEEVINES